MLAKVTIQIYRAISVILVLTPLFIHLLFNFSIVTMFLYLPFLSLSLAVIAKFIDYKLMDALTIRASKPKITKVGESNTIKLKQALSQKAA